MTFWSDRMTHCPNRIIHYTLYISKSGEIGASLYFGIMLLMLGFIFSMPLSMGARRKMYMTLSSTAT